VDVDELKKRCEMLEAELARKQAMLDILMDKNPDGICILEPGGALIVNPAGAAMTNTVPSVPAEDDWQTSFGYFRPDKTTPFPVEELPVMRGAQGHVVKEELLWLVGPSNPEGVMLACSAQPLPGGGAVSIFRDVTERLQLESDLAKRNAELSQREGENRELIERLRLALDELSTPVLEVGEDVLVLPVIGVVDTQRSAQMSERLLSEVVRTRAKFAIVDLTGVEVIDTATADRFVKLARAVELLGARCVVSGLQPAVAQTLVELGVEFTGLSTQRNLRHALEACKSPAQKTRQATRPRA
jgi:rsbT co-antagonist protein RsbR